MEQCDDMGAVPDQVLVNCSGGGLTAGVAIAVKAHREATDIFPVEPEDFDDTRRSIESGKPETNDPSARTICDSLMSAPPGEITFEINRRLATRVLTVSDEEVREAIRFAFRHLKLVVEPGGSAGLAALLAGKLDTKDKTSVAILSGGNIDAALFAEIQTG
jgi:threonine dehydratase